MIHFRTSAISVSSAPPVRLRKISSRLVCPVLSSVRKFIHGAHGDQLTFVDDPDAVAHALGDLQDVGGEHDRRAAVCQLAQDILDQARGLRVQPHGRLIEHEHPGIVHQRRGQGGLLLHAVTVGIDRIVCRSGQVEHAQQLIDAARRLVAVEVVKIADKTEQFAPGQFGIQVGGVGHVTAGGFRQPGLCLNIIARDLDRPGGGLEQTDDHLDGGGLPGAVRTEKAEYLAAVHIKTDIIHRDLVAVAFDKIPRFDQGFRHKFSIRSIMITIYFIRIRLKKGVRHPRAERMVETFRRDQKSKRK